jgi:hypothetical protein
MFCDKNLIVSKKILVLKFNFVTINSARSTLFLRKEIIRIRICTCDQRIRNRSGTVC